ncbi:MAG: hypothetical protein OXC68_10910 [Aestuariivita sp.]|nr:hypothetical protein [Aestuariivita sp.]
MLLKDHPYQGQAGPTGRHDQCGDRLASGHPDAPGPQHTPELAADTLFSECELAMLKDFARERNINFHSRGKDADLLELSEITRGEAVCMVTRIGGYLDRKCDGPPGHQIVWEGYTQMTVGAKALEQVMTFSENSAIYDVNVPTKMTNGQGATNRTVIWTVLATARKQD